MDRKSVEELQSQFKVLADHIVSVQSRKLSLNARRQMPQSDSLQSTLEWINTEIKKENAE